MCAQFGIWSLSGKPRSQEILTRAGRPLIAYGPDRSGLHSEGDLYITYHALDTTKESEHISQPYKSASGLIVTWDGRLDNRMELLCELGENPAEAAADVWIAARALDRWWLDALSRLIGDWCVSIWDPHQHCLILAKDPIGPRHLFYTSTPDGIAWCTILDPLVGIAGDTHTLSEEYLAGSLTYFPASHLTPYRDILAVPSASAVLFTSRGKTVQRYWRFDPQNTIHYRSDFEYEQHFRALFRQAVERRLRSSTPVLAELSGGMDSSAIVCMADQCAADRGSHAPRVDTLSYYDDSEPNWNERPFFTAVETQRGRIGHHIEISEHPFDLGGGQSFAATPFSSAVETSTKLRLRATLRSQNYRVLLSGLGGDEVLGGNPNPHPELLDLLRLGQFQRLSRQLMVWALQQRRPWLHLLLEVIRSFLPAVWADSQHSLHPKTWFNAGFTARNRPALSGYPRRKKVFGPLPSFQENISALEALERQLASIPEPADPPYETRYPFLDRNLLEFLFAVPREQLVRPGCRRSLMRRSLRSIVPREIIDRKRKAFVVRRPMNAIAEQWPSLFDFSQDLLTSTAGIVDSKAFQEVLAAARDGHEVSIVTLMRTISLECWLRSLRKTVSLRIVPSRDSVVRNHEHHSLSVDAGEIP